MAEKMKGKCKYCGKEYTRGYMKRHLAACKGRQKAFETETGGKKYGYFLLEVCAKYNKNYWLLLEIREDSKLSDVDSFLRDIWLECCGHLSAFYINGVSYEVASDEDFFWGKPPKSMNYALKTVLRKDMKIGYEYDFGSTTELEITVVDYRIGYRSAEKITILSRNNPPQLVCSECGKKPAAYICPQCAWDGNGLLCGECAKTHECGEQMLLAVCNSPRMGVCGYEGSNLYPDQFVPDTEEQKY